MVSTKRSPYIEKSTKGVNPEWANLPRRRCDNCGKMYKPKQPLRATDKYGFCDPACKKQFHKHGAAFIKLKDVCMKALPALVSAAVKAELERSGIRRDA